MLKLLPIVLLVCAVSTSFARQDIPEGPHPAKTPGSLCANSTTLRYPEKIKYCDRDVPTGLKKRIIQEYDVEFGYEIQQLPRADFKIDHLIPLSIGGSNDISNLWPQHKSVYAYSDPLETSVFELISVGKIKQAEAIRVIKTCKLNLGRCAEMGDYLKSLY